MGGIVIAYWSNSGIEAIMYRVLHVILSHKF